MAMSRAPKQWCLTKSETVNSFENWKQNLIYTLTLDPQFAPFLVDGSVWQKKTKAAPRRGFTDDGDAIPEAKRRTADQKVTQLELMLGQIANFCPVISRNTIVKNSTSLACIWQAIRLHYGFQSSGAHFLDFADIRLEADERPEDLYQRLMAFAEDNLLQQNGGITHHGEVPEEDEEMSPSLENLIVLVWLRSIHKDLPKLIKQRYGTELRSRTLASIKPEISQALQSLIEELQTTEDARVMRAASFSVKSHTSSSSRPSRQTSFTRTCPLCQQAKRPRFNHFLSKCPYLPEADRRFLTRARCIIAEEEEDMSPDPCLDSEEREATVHASRRVQVNQSPYINAFYNHHAVKLTIDSGAETNMIKESAAIHIGAPITKSSQIALQADGQSPLSVKGETHIILTRDNHKFVYEALVVENMDVDLLAGVPFMTANDVGVRPAKLQVLVKNDHIYSYGVSSTKKGPHSVRRTQAQILRAPSSTTTIWPGEFIELDIPKDMGEDVKIAIEPRIEANKPSSKDMWPAPSIVHSVGTKVRIANESYEPKTLKRNEHFCQVLFVFSPPGIQHEEGKSLIQATSTSHQPSKHHSKDVKVDPDGILPEDIRSSFKELHSELDEVFNPDYKGYNGAVGPFEATVNMGPVQPPQRKGRLPQYSRDKLCELQDKLDSMERSGVIKRPEDIGVSVEYVNPSFLVKKPCGGYRLVTAFADVGRYSKPQPSLLPNVDSTLRTIARWKYIIISDLASAYFQIPLSRSSMKYCGIVSPFKGVRVYTRCAMGMPGSETALEELLCRVLGDLLQEGVVAKIADDLYCGANTPEELLNNWRRVLTALHNSSLTVSATKTIVAPSTAVVLGWIWSHGSIKASPHRIATLAACSPPATVKGLRSFIGAYKILARVIPSCATFTARLEEGTAGGSSRDKVVWSDKLREAFLAAQKALSTNKPITIPRPEDQLWIVTDGAVRNQGLGATLYITGRGSKPLIAGFFSSKFHKNQKDWIPCEVEALCIASAVSYFSPYLIQSELPACVLTDSKPCVQAYERLCRGEFSNSARVATYLATISRYQVSVRHLSGSANLLADFACRNAPDCEIPSCQVCTFIAQTADSVVRQVSAQDILSGTAQAPYTSRPAWILTQSECADLRRTKAHLLQGTRPSKKATNIKDVKRYLQVATVGRDGLLVVKKTDVLSTSRECIIIPRQVLEGLLTALHIYLVHPTAHQLKLVARRYFYALDMDKAIEQVYASCHHCASVKKSPHALLEQATSDPPESVGIAFATDVIKRQRQLILVLREIVTSYTAACIIDSEKASSLKEALVKLCIELRPLDGPLAVIRSDPAPGFRSLIDDELLQKNRICIELGQEKNINKNPVAEKAVQEVEDELQRQNPRGGPVSTLELSVAIARLNSRIRNRGLSSREMLYQRDQFTNKQLPIQDRSLIEEQHARRNENHPYSEKSKTSKHLHISEPIKVGDLIYIYADRNKTCARDRYIVVSEEGDWVNVRKFTGSQLRSKSYRIRKSQCFKVASTSSFSTYNRQSCSSDSDEDLISNVQPTSSNVTTSSSYPSISKEPTTTTSSTSPDASLFVPSIPLEISQVPTSNTSSVVPLPDQSLDVDSQQYEEDVEPPSSIPTKRADKQTVTVKPHQCLELRRSSRVKRQPDFYDASRS